MKNAILKSIIILSSTVIMISCNSTNRLTAKNQEKMFKEEQIKEKLSKVKTGADFPALAMDLKNIGVTYYETKMMDGRSIYHGQNGYELLAGPNYKQIKVADKANLEQLKLDIANHQQGKSDYFQISRQCANNGIEKWAVCLTSMTCTYIDKSGNRIWVEHIPDIANPKPSFTIDQVKAAHSKVKSGADFPQYIRDIKTLGVHAYDTYVEDGHSDFKGENGYYISSSAMYDKLRISETINAASFRKGLKEHQEGLTDYSTFCELCATCGVEKWTVSIDAMTCTYFDKAGKQILVEHVPQ